MSKNNKSKKSVDKDNLEKNNVEIDATEASVDSTEVVKKQESEEPPVPQTKVQRFFGKFDIFGDLFFLNIIFVVSCIPVFTIGAAFTALYTVTNKMVMGKEGPVKDEYIKAFKENFKQATSIWIVDLIYLFLFYLQYGYYLSNDNNVTKYLFIFMGFEFILFAFAFPLQFPLLARYENTTLKMIINSLVLSVANITVWFRLFFIWMFPVVLYYLRPNWFIYTWYLWVLFVFALFTYVCSMFLAKFYEKLEKPKKPEK